VALRPVCHLRWRRGTRSSSSGIELLHAYVPWVATVSNDICAQRWCILWRSALALGLPQTMDMRRLWAVAAVRFVEATHVKWRCGAGLVWSPATVKRVLVQATLFMV
jgi:hypothetical protein